VSRRDEEIRRLAAEGLSPNAIARRLHLAGPTVDYHLGREPAPRRRKARPERLAEPCRAVPTRERVAALLAAGLSRAEVARELGLTKGTVSYHARRLGQLIDSRCSRRYDWDEVQAYYDAGHSVRDCQSRFGFSRDSWSEAVKRGAVIARAAGMPLDELLVSGVYRSRHNLKVRLLSSGLKENRCEGCGLTEWREAPLSMSLHHVNGDRQDNRVENLQLLCPNCHSQTDNFAGRATRKDLARPAS
jgi:DNA-binding CsgD family transcriptional regulator